MAGYATNGGAMEAATRGYAAPNFQCLSNYMRFTDIFICPTDTERVRATNFSEFRNQNTSYFVAVDAGTNASNSILTGDRNLADGGKTLNPGLFIHTPLSKMNWTRALHNTNPRLTMGGLSFVDGHAEVIKGTHLDAVFLREDLATNRLAVP